MRKPCTVTGCDRTNFGHGYCQKHYSRWRKYGDPNATPRFDPWTRVDKTAGPDGCWPWTGAIDKQGYGLVKIKGRQWRAPRWVLTQTLGRDLTPSEVTRHDCDNPACCNPAHLRVGTARDNAADMVARGRSNHGDAHWTRRTPDALHRGTKNAAAKITEAEVLAIRSAYAAGARQVDLAAAYSISQPTISQIVRRKIWTNI